MEEEGSRAERASTGGGTQDAWGASDLLDMAECGLQAVVQARQRCDSSMHRVSVWISSGAPGGLSAGMLGPGLWRGSERAVRKSHGLTACWCSVAVFKI